ncbi:permease [Natronospora cellulosivora (SeqCode)]
MIRYLADLLIYKLFGFEAGTRLGDSLHFFVYDTIKILFLLAIMIFFISLIRSYFPPERTKKILEKQPKFFGNVLASLLGVVTPFCSCSSVPIFIGFIESGVPLGMTFSFLITSPIVNQIALVMLYSLFGWQIATIYLLSGIFVGVIGGIIIETLHLENEVEEYVYQISIDKQEIEELNMQERIDFAKNEVKDIVSRIWKYVLIGIGIGAFIYGYAPEDLLTQYAGPGNPFAVLIAVILGIPLYANVVGVIPIVQSLLSKGVAIGTGLSFMMSITALSLPALIILRKVIKPKLLIIFVTVVALSIIGLGYLFNFLLI